MKNNIFPIELVSIVTSTDAINQTIEEERTTASIFAQISSITQTEFFSAGKLGFQPSFKAVIFDFEYNNEPILKWNNKLYSIYRTYAINGTDKLELYLEERSGTKDEPNTSSGNA